MNTNEFLKLTRTEQKYGGRLRGLGVRPRVVCEDGYSISIQAGASFYCEPRDYVAERYSEVELGYPNREDELIADYAEEPGNITRTVYPYVPVEIVDELLAKHGGIINF